MVNHAPESGNFAFKDSSPHWEDPVQDILNSLLSSLQYEWCPYYDVSRNKHSKKPTNRAKYWNQSPIMSLPQKSKRVDSELKSEIERHLLEING